MLKTIKMTKIKIIVLLILTTQLSSCQKKMENYKTEKFEWEGNVTSPEGYSMIVVSPNVFYSDGGKFITLIPNMSGTEGSDWTGSGRGWASNPAPIPDHLSIAWFSNTENKFYEGEFELPQKKIYDLFKEGYLIYSIPIINDNGKALLHKETFTAITVGLAPKGMVVVWASGQNKVEIGRYQGKEIGKEESNRMWKHFFKGVGGSDPGNMPLQIPNKELETFLPHVQQEIREGKISCKQWDDYRLRYNWKVEFNKLLEMYSYYIGYFNSEYVGYLPTSITQEVFNKNILEPTSKVVPNNLGMYVTTKNGRNYLIKLETLDEQETIEAFKKLEEANPKAIITIFISVDDDFKKFSVTLKNDKKEIILEKALLRLFTLDKSNDLKNEK
jgi:hypothetical protein